MNHPETIVLKAYMPLSHTKIRIVCLKSKAAKNIRIKANLKGKS